MDRLLTLLDLQRQAQEASSLAAFAHIVVNDTQRLIAYDEALFFTAAGNTLTLEAASGNADFDAKAPFAQGVLSILRDAKNVLNPGQSLYRVPSRTLAAQLERPAGEALVVFFQGRDSAITGGLWIYRAKPFLPAEEPLVSELAHGYGVGLSLLRSGAGGSTLRAALRDMGKVKRLALVALLVLAFMPVRLSVSAPAEIAAKDSRVVTSPFDGIIEEVAVSPGDAVTTGQVLARMEETALRARMDMAQETLNTAQTALSRLRREALANPEKRMEMTALQSDIALKRLDYDYASSLLSRTKVTAPRDGIAVFADRNALLGRPVSTGDILMQIADPAEKELLIRIPADGMIRLTKESKVRFHLNVAPLTGHDASIETLGYQASADPDGLLTYKIRATLPDDAGDMRIGWKGTARLEEGWTILSYAVLRRPLVALRRTIGF